MTPWWLWVGLAAALIALLLLDLFVFHRRPNEVRVRQAVVWSAFWLALGLGFALVVGAVEGGTAAREYLAGYLIERTLSLDNLFVLAVILGYFAVPSAIRHRALFWGVVGALVFRAVFIVVGGAALERLSWLAYALGGFLVVTGMRMARREVEVNPEHNRVVTAVRADDPLLPWATIVRTHCSHRLAVPRSADRARGRCEHRLDRDVADAPLRERLDGSCASDRELAAVDTALVPFADEGIVFHALRTRRAGRRSFVSVHVLVPASGA